MNISSSLSGLASAYAAISGRSSTSKTSSASYAGETTTSSQSSEASGPRGPRPPGPPPEFDVQRSTAQFAGSRGADPIASLDGDADGAVSAEEFGLSDASSEVQQLFAAIDGDQDGSLSGEEIDSFRTQMQEAMQAQGPQGGRPMGPPPPPPSDSSESDDDNSTEASTGTQTSAQLTAMLQRIAQDYLSLMESGTQAATQASGGSLSVTA